MKKLFFTAIALVAFSGVSMASTLEIKEVEIVQKPIEIIFQDCAGYALSATTAESTARNTVMTRTQFAAAYTGWFNDCVEANKAGSIILAPVFISN